MEAIHWQQPEPGPSHPLEGAALADAGKRGVDFAARAAAETLIRSHQAGVWRYLRVLGCAPDLADDLTQETFLIAIDRGLLDENSGATRSFLRRTARFVFLRLHHKDRRRQELLADAADFLWDSDCAQEVGDDGDEWLVALRACVESTELRSRRALTMVYRDGASRSDVAADLGMQENGVKTLLHRVRNSLRECVQRRMSRWNG